MFFPHSHELERMPEMKKSFAWFSAAVLAALLFSGAQAHAQSVPWSYGAMSSDPISATSSPLSSITFSGSSGNPSGNSGIIIYTVTTSSLNDGVSQPADYFNNVPFNLAVNLSDTNSLKAKSGTVNTTGVVNFSGLFNATNVTAQSLLPGVNTWTLVPGNASPTSASVILGADDPSIGWRKYQVDLISFTSPGQPGGAPGSIQAVVTITPADGPGGSGETPNPSAAPEPASMVLAALGLPLILLVRRRLKKTQD
jgi:hypothetical protein